MSPWSTSYGIDVDSELVGDDLRPGGLRAGREGDVPVTTCTEPSGWKRIVAASHLRPHSGSHRGCGTAQGRISLYVEKPTRPPAPSPRARPLGLVGLDRVEVQQLEQSVEAAVVVTRVDRQPGRHRVRKFADEVPPPQLDAIDAELGRKRVHRPLEHVGRLGPSGPPVRVGRRRVREYAGEGDAVVGIAYGRVEPRTQQRNPGVTSWRYAPIAHFASDLTAVMPSFVAANVSSCTTSRPWIVAT